MKKIIVLIALMAAAMTASAQFDSLKIRYEVDSLCLANHYSAEMTKLNALKRLRDHADGIKVQYYLVSMSEQMEHRTKDEWTVEIEKQRAVLKSIADEFTVIREKYVANALAVPTITTLQRKALLKMKIEMLEYRGETGKPLLDAYTELGKLEEKR